MKPYGEYKHAAIPGDPFPDVGEREAWQFSVCQGGGVDVRRCVNDDTIDDDGGCGLMLLSYDELTPQEWTEAGADGTPRVVYRCTEKTTPDQVVS